MQVMLWTDESTLLLQKNSSIQFSSGVETRDIFALIFKMVNYDIMSKLTNIGAITDLMKYEVRPYNIIYTRYLESH